MATGANPDKHASNGTSHPSGGAEALTPDRDMLIRFVDVMFRNADRRGFVSFRVFMDNGKSERAILISACRLDDHEFEPLMLIPAQQAANWYEPAVFAPPVCTFRAIATRRPIISLKASRSPSIATGHIASAAPHSRPYWAPPPSSR
jgi:hypothetical protein